MNPIVLAAKALSVPFCLHLHSQHLKKTHAPVGLNLTRVTSTYCILSSKQGSHCSSTAEDIFPEKLCGYLSFVCNSLLLIVAQVSKNAEDLRA